MDDELLSIVVPVYNVAPYLDRSIRSILGQTYKNLELVLVNDGSTDSSGEICEKYARIDPRVKLISQENRGLASAWKTGVKQASGAYLGFVDPDDYIDNDMYKELMNRRSDFDMVIAQWKRESEGNIRRSHDTFALGAYRTQADMNFLIRHLINISLPGGSVNIQPGIAAYLWNKLFKTDMVKEAFEELDFFLPFSNDRPILYSLVLKCRSVLITDVCGYHYQVHSSSLSHVSDHQCDYLRTICEFYNLMKSRFEQDARYDVLMPQLQLKMSEQIARAPVKMGFGPEAQLQLRTPIFPFLNLLNGKHIALYGCGTVGRSYRRQIQQWNECHVDLWVDEDWQEYSRAGMDVRPVESLLDTSCDCILIAVADQIEAERIRRDMISMGITNNNILWKEPFQL